jgi:hypothetical protein
MKMAVDRFRRTEFVAADLHPELSRFSLECFPQECVSAGRLSIINQTYLIIDRIAAMLFSEAGFSGGNRTKSQCRVTGRVHREE